MICTYEEFKVKLMEDAKNLAADVIGPEAEVSIEETDIKGHRTEVLRIKLTREFIQLEKIGYGCELELRPAYETYLRKPAWAGLIHSLREKLEEIKKLPKKNNIGNFKTFESVKDHLFLTPLPFQKREEAGIEICLMIDDIPIAVCFVTSNDEKFTSVARITSKLLELWNVSEEEVLVAAMKNQMNAAKPVLIPMCDLYPFERMLIRDRNDEFAYVGTTERNWGGAVVISYSGFLDRACEEMGEDVFIYPSSIHEVVLVKESYLKGKMIDDADEFVNHVNKQLVNDEDILSDKVYHYERATQKFESARAWHKRVHGTDL